MSRFNALARRLRDCPDEPGGRTWVDFHRCVEAFSRTTGEPFCDVFERLGRTHGFERGEKIPAGTRLRAAVRQLAEERETWLARRAELVRERREAKRRGLREPPPGELDQRERKRNAWIELQPRVGYWGWRRLRDGTLGARSTTVAGLRVEEGAGWLFLVPPSSPGDHLDTAAVDALVAALGEPGRTTIRLVLLVGEDQFAFWADRERAELSDALRRLRRLTIGPASIWVRCREPSTTRLSDVVRDTFEDVGWRVALLHDD